MNASREDREKGGGVRKHLIPVFASRYGVRSRQSNILGWLGNGFTTVYCVHTLVFATEA